MVNGVWCAAVCCGELSFLRRLGKNWKKFKIPFWGSIFAFWNVVKQIAAKFNTNDSLKRTILSRYLAFDMRINTKYGAFKTSKLVFFYHHITLHRFLELLRSLLIILKYICCTLY